VSETAQVEEKKKELTTLEIQELIYKRHLELFKLRKGMTLDELLRRANDPRRYTKSKKPK
jgi:hypothetical protein